MQGLVNGVEYLHDRGLIHRDLKPANIYRENGVVKIGDVGLSKRIDGNHRNQHTESIGTVYYMAPEITHGKYGPQVDVYSLGIILYEMLTGRLPFNGETSGEILMKQLSAAPDLSVLPPNLKPVLARALEKDPMKRTPSARQLGTDFEQASSATAIPESHFVNGKANHVSTTERSRRDTDRTGDTGRKPVKTAAPQSGMAYEAGRLWGAITQNPPPKKRDDKPKLHARRNYWGVRSLIGLAVLVVIAYPWHLLAGEERLAAVAVIALSTVFLSSLLWAREYWRPDDEPVWQPALFTRWRFQSPHDWFGTLAIGALGAGLFSVVGQLAAWNLAHVHHMIRRPDTMVYFTAVAVLGVWSAIGCRWLATRHAWADKHPRLLYAGAGIVVATAAVALGDYLLIEIGPNNLWGGAAFDHLGANPLRAGTHLQPTWMGYVVFFGGLFGLLGKRLNRLQRPERASRWSLWNVVASSVLAWLWVHLFAFPQLMGVLWAATIAASVQLAAPWQPAVSSQVRK
jgi:hypothetical protein